MKLTVSHKKTFLSTLFITLGIVIICGAGLYAYQRYTDASKAAQQRAIQQEERIEREKATAVKEALKKQPVIIQLPNAKPITARVENYTQPNSLWVVVNKVQGISTDYVPRPLVIPDVLGRTDKSIEEQSVREDIAVPLKTMFAAAQKDGHALMIGSAYRSAALQKSYFDNYAAVSGADAANMLSAHPGESEHQTGLAVDISSVSRNCYLNECFTSTPDGQWLAEHAYLYGFTLRYPEGKTAITGYNFEPWHYRYVGIALATALYESKLTLDEAMPYLEAAQKTLIKNGALDS